MIFISGTIEAYQAAYSDISKFINAKEERKCLQSWLNWWHDRRQYIFRAFTTVSAPRSNLAEVVHASWTNRDSTGLSLLESTEFDTRDSLILETQITQLMTSSKGHGDGPSMVALAERKQVQEIESATRKGLDLLDHGVSAVSTGKRKLPTIDSHGGSNPPKRGLTESIERMFIARRDAALNLVDSMKIRDHKVVSTLKRIYKVSGSTSGRKTYMVEISNTPSCTCPDFQKQGAKVLCKHVLFVVLFVLSGDGMEIQLQDRYLCDADLRRIFDAAGKTIPPRYVQERAPAKTKREFAAILKDHDGYEQEQKWTLHVKQKRSAVCLGCKKVLQRGTECFSVEGALTVPFNKNKAVLQTFYCCASKFCTSQSPPWTNLKKPLSIECDPQITTDRKEIVIKLLDIEV